MKAARSKSRRDDFSKSIYSHLQIALLSRQFQCLVRNVEGVKTDRVIVVNQPNSQCSTEGFPVKWTLTWECISAGGVHDESRKSKYAVSACNVPDLLRFWRSKSATTGSI